MSGWSRGTGKALAGAVKPRSNQCPLWVETGHGKFEWQAYVRCDRPLRVIVGVAPLLTSLFFLASTARCVALELCPSDQEVRAAIRARDLAVANDPTARSVAIKHGISVDRSPAFSIEAVHCGPAMDAGHQQVSCSYTLNYPTETIYEGEIFRWEAGRWIIPDAVEAARKVGTLTR